VISEKNSWDVCLLEILYSDIGFNFARVICDTSSPDINGFIEAIEMNGLKGHKREIF
jgi:hypothetical protein